MKERDVLRKMMVMVLVFSMVFILTSCDLSSSSRETIEDVRTGVGSVSGYVTAPDEVTPIIGATVVVDKLAIQTSTDEEGFYTLSDISVGQQNIIAFKGNFKAEIMVNIAAGENVQVDNVVLQPTGKIGVNNGSYDDIAGILEKLGFEYENINLATLADSSKLEEFVVLFFECGGLSITENSTEANNLLNFIENGGYIYASDYALDIPARLFSDKIDLLGRVGEGRDEDVLANIHNEDIKFILGKDTINLNYYDSPGWNVINSVAEDVSIDVTGDIYVSGEIVEDSPLLVHLTYGDGYVILTTFHNATNATEDMLIILQQMAFGF